MAALGLQYTVAPGLQVSMPHDLVLVGYEMSAISDLDASESLYTADFTITGDYQELFFAIGTGATAGTITLELYHGTTHANKVDTKALVKGGVTNSGASISVAADSVVLDMTVAADRKAIIGVSPIGQQTSSGTVVAWVGTTNKISLKFTGSSDLTDSSAVYVMLFAKNRRHVPGPKAGA